MRTARRVYIATPLLSPTLCAPETEREASVELRDPSMTATSPTLSPPAMKAAEAGRVLRVRGGARCATDCPEGGHLLVVDCVNVQKQAHVEGNHRVAVN